MKTILSIAISAVLLPQFAAAQSTLGDLILPSFDTVRELNRQDAGGILPADYKVEPGPGYNDSRQPQEPPNLTFAQAMDLVTKLERLEIEKTGKSTLGADQNNQRLLQRLAEIDTQFVDTVTKDRWDQILGQMYKVAEDNFEGDGGRWPALIDKMLKRGVGMLRDPHSVYWTAKEYKQFNDSMSGSFSGLGVQIKEVPKGVRVEVIFPGSGAEEAGLQKGDVITKVDGEDMSGKPTSYIIPKMVGEPNTTVDIHVIRAGKLVGPITVTRKVVKTPNAFSRMQADGVGYIYFNQFQGDTDTTVFKHVRRLLANGAKGIILDVRGNGGGRVDSAASLISEFLKDKDDIVAFKKQGEVQVKFITDGDGEFNTVPVVVLVNGYSASASEILAGAFQDHHEGTVVIGSQSYGKGTAQGISPGPTGGALKMTTSRWYTPADRTIDADHDPNTGAKIDGTGGVTPDVVVEVSEEQEAKIMGEIFRELRGLEVTERTPDPVIEKAVEVIGALKAS